ncbi:lipoprotein signal peptidase [Hymenobacter convexus]|uniref:lipoprotein signal peptidase n=1 Tax=Hymenobacter sp. CA1UV-4 TaxID=3063782 RepID=UPI0027129A7B|nr:lipoprotein signal peptidase [Hymenobacter sp. CA1UV-4]MDO7850860.1 lipoprotein signal peptidase [Hymenobacter sp. CA1UV-4]
MHPTLTTRQHSAAKFFLLALFIIAIDQLSKYLVHSYMQLGSAGEIPIFGQWAKLTYTLNPGMAFGAELPAPYGKLVLTGFRMLAVGGLIYYIIRLCRQRVAAGYIACMALILGGAVGNLIDSIFYGIIYNNAPVGSPTRWFYGQVIDMIFVPLYVGYFPKSWPLIGGSYSNGFPIFNIADSSIFIGVALILLNQSRFFNESQPAAAPNEPQPPVAADAEKLV